MRHVVKRWALALLALIPCAGLVALAYQSEPRTGELPNRIPQAAPYDVAEARHFPPPFEEAWEGQHNPGKLRHLPRQDLQRVERLDDVELLARSGLARRPSSSPPARPRRPATARSPRRRTARRAPSQPVRRRRLHEHFRHRRRPRRRPPAPARCSTASAPSATCRPTTWTTCRWRRRRRPALGPGARPARSRSSTPRRTPAPGSPSPPWSRASATPTPGKRGIFCAVCHTFADTREMPFRQLPQVGHSVSRRAGHASRARQLPPASQDRSPSPTRPRPTRATPSAPAPTACRRTPSASPILRAADRGRPRRPGCDPYLSGVFKHRVPYQQASFRSGTRAITRCSTSGPRCCAACHDVTNPLTVKNRLGRWVGGFPIERTYTEWRASRYADRPGNRNFDPRFKRDCQTCHMQQDLRPAGHRPDALPRTATGRRRAPAAWPTTAPSAPVPSATTSSAATPSCPGWPGRTSTTRGSVAALSRAVGLQLHLGGRDEPLPQRLLRERPAPAAPITQHARLAWDRLRNVLDLDLAGPAGRRPPAAARPCR